MFKEVVYHQIPICFRKAKRSMVQLSPMTLRSGQTTQGKDSSLKTTAARTPDNVDVLRTVLRTGGWIREKLLYTSVGAVHSLENSTSSRTSPNFTKAFISIKPTVPLMFQRPPVCIYRALRKQYRNLHFGIKISLRGKSP